MPLAETVETIARFAAPAPVFALPRLDTTDVRSDALRDCFDFHQDPRAFVSIPSTQNAAFFLQQRAEADPDDDGGTDAG